MLIAFGPAWDDLLRPPWASALAKRGACGGSSLRRALLTVAGDQAIHQARDTKRVGIFQGIG